MDEPQLVADEPDGAWWERTGTWVALGSAVLAVAVVLVFLVVGMSSSGAAGGCGGG